MKRLLVLLALGTLALAASAVPPGVKEARSSAYNLWVLDGGLMQVICTGTIVQDDEGPVFLTAGHCVADAPRARYYISQAVDPEYLVRVVLKWWEFKGIDSWTDGDYAIFRLPEGFKAPALPVCRGNPQPGDYVWAWTGPIGMLPILRTGIYSGELHFPDSPDDEAAVGGMPFVDIEGAPGSSGSGMLAEEDGRICVWGVWVGGFRNKPSGAIVSPVPPVLRPQ